MRDISSYEVEYNKEICESIQVQYRKKIIIEQIKKYNHGSILEIGCGNSPLFDDFFDYNYIAIIDYIFLFFFFILLLFFISWLKIRSIKFH